jgi:hypothetical protein
MPHANLVRSPFIPRVWDVVVVLGVLGEATTDVVAQWSWMKLCSSGREGHLFVGWTSLF